MIRVGRGFRGSSRRRPHPEAGGAPGSSAEEVFSISGWHPVVDGLRARMRMKRLSLCAVGLGFFVGCVRQPDRIETGSGAEAPAARESSTRHGASAAEAPGGHDFFGASLELTDRQGRALPCRGIAKAGGRILVQRDADKQRFVLEAANLSAESRSRLERFADTREDELTAFVDRRDYAAAKRSVKVELVSASWCGWCDKAKEFFAKEKIPYQVFDYESHGGRSRQNEWGSTGLPTVKIGGKVVRGYSEQSYREALLAEYRKADAG